MKRKLELAIVATTGIIAVAGFCRGAVSEYPSNKPAVLSSNFFPCSNCHAGLTPDAAKRSLTFHTEIRLKEHDEQGMWCLSCHDAAERDRLRLASGGKIVFLDLHLLCGQCHANIYRHWRAGIHGKRTGSWEGEKQYYLCTNCHNPHSPRFKPLTPEPAPIKPADTLRG